MWSNTRSNRQHHWYRKQHEQLKKLLRGRRQGTSAGVQIRKTGLISSAELKVLSAELDPTDKSGGLSKEEVFSLALPEH